MTDEAGLYERIRALLEEGGIEPTPSNYEFLFRYVSGADPELTEAADAARAAHGRIDQATIGRIRHALYGAGSGGVGRLLDDAERQLSAMTDYVERSDAETRDYRERLGRSHIEAAATLERQRAVLSEILDATNLMIAQTERLQEEIGRSSREIDLLKADLEVARVESRLDALTGLANRKACCDYLHAQIERTQADSRALALIFIDIDYFKAFNDNFGHRMGDEVLRLVGKSLERFFHGTGFVSRWGGEEFVVVMPGRDAEDAASHAERFRAEIAGRTVRARASGREVGRITLSLGVSGMIAGDTAQTLIDRADAALYDAKAEGRDRVITHRQAA